MDVERAPAFLWLFAEVSVAPYVDIDMSVRSSFSSADAVLPTSMSARSMSTLQSRTLKISLVVCASGAAAYLDTDPGVFCRAAVSRRMNTAGIHRMQMPRSYGVKTTGRDGEGCNLAEAASSHHPECETDAATQYPTSGLHRALRRCRCDTVSRDKRHSSVSTAGEGTDEEGDKEDDDDDDDDDEEEEEDTDEEAQAVAAEAVAGELDEDSGPNADTSAEACAATAGDISARCSGNEKCMT